MKDGTWDPVLWSLFKEVISMAAVVLFIWISVFKALCILLLLLQHPTSILIFLSLISICVYQYTHIPLFCFFFLFVARDGLMGEDDNAGWLLPDPAIAGLMLNRLQLGSAAEFTSPSWKHSNVSQRQKDLFLSTGFGGGL